MFEAHSMTPDFAVVGAPQWHGFGSVGCSKPPADADAGPLTESPLNEPRWLAMYRLQFAVGSFGLACLMVPLRYRWLLGMLPGAGSRNLTEKD